MINDILTPEKLKRILPNNSNINDWYDSLIKILPDYEIDTEKRVSAFLAQTAHESANYTRLIENLNYSAKRLMEVWPKRFPTMSIAKQYERNPQKLGNFTYANRMGNGPVESGDGYEYRGRGLIQITGKSNYESFGESIGISSKDAAEYMETFDGAVHSACWFWEVNKLNSYSDKGDIRNQTIKINGGTNGLSDRVNRYLKYLKILQE
ncbi:MAG: glycoside hydrolase family 19 protein [Clostridia bacterium]|nr:glycoside hydrolase family 19 protein [Clostridia bacterium]